LTADDRLIRELTGSALQFLDRAIDEFKSNPKFSTIFFATAVELFLKARLMREHWSLVIEKADQATRARFLAGQARTVTPQIALSRLKDLVGLPISPDATATFGQVADHRNRMIHFVHDAEGGGDDAVRQVAAEQIRGWSHLRMLLRSWDTDLPWLAQDLQRIEVKMRGHREFLNAVFDTLRPEIRQLRSTGKRIVGCPVCGLEAAVVTPVTSQVGDMACLVCSAVDTLITMECPEEDCGAPVDLPGWWGAAQKCPVCGETITSDQISADLDTTLRDLSDPHTAMNCALCQSPDSVVEHEDIYVCIECFGYERSIAYCESCDELQIGGGDLRYSYNVGCEFCEGRGLGD
jgi:hypothetical protein